MRLAPNSDFLPLDGRGQNWGCLHLYPGLPPSNGEGTESRSAYLPFMFLVTLTFALTRLLEGFAEHHARHVEFVIGTAQ